MLPSLLARCHHRLPEKDLEDSILMAKRNVRILCKETNLLGRDDGAWPRGKPDTVGCAAETHAHGFREKISGSIFSSTPYRQWSPTFDISVGITYPWSSYT